jgi:hypothetical protein
VATNVKIPRHALSRRTVSELERARAGVVSPEQAAAGAAAPYQAVASVAADASDVFKVIDESNRRIKEAESKVTLSNLKNMREAKLAEMGRLAEEHNWTPEQYEEASDNILKGYEAGLVTVEDEQIRSLASQEVQGEHSILQERVLSVSGAIRAERANEAWNQGMLVLADELQNTPPERRDYRRMREHIQTGIEAGTVDPIEGEQKLQSLEDAEVGNDLFLSYKAAVDKGDEATAKFEASVAEGNYTDGAKAAFFGEKIQYDKLIAGQQAEIDAAENRVRERSIVNFYNSIDLSQNEDGTLVYNDDMLHAFADAHEMTLGQRQGLFNERERQATAKSKYFDSDRTTKGYREGVDWLAQQSVGSQVDEDGNIVPPSVGDIWDWQVQNLEQNGALGQSLMEFVNNSVQSTHTRWQEGQGGPTGDIGENLDYMDAVFIYRDAMKQNPKFKTNGWDSDTYAFLQSTYRAAERMGGSNDAYIRAGKEQQAIHVEQKFGSDAVKIADSEFDAIGASLIMDDLGDVAESAGYSIEGIINNREYKFDSAFLTAYSAIARDMARYQQATTGDINWGNAQGDALQRMMSSAGENYLNDGVPTGGGKNVLNGEVYDIPNEMGPMISFHSLPDTDTAEGAKVVRREFEEEYLGEGNNKVKVGGQTYTIIPNKKPYGEALPESVAGGPKKYEIEIGDIELFIGTHPTYDENGAMQADLRYMGNVVNTMDNDMAWFSRPPRVETNISGGPERADVNERIADAQGR